MKLKKENIKNILLGASLLGTGGGGRYSLAEKTLREITNIVSLVPIESVRQKELIITAYMVGGLRSKGDLGTGISRSIDLLKKALNKNIKFLIPVEIGPTAVINLLNIASKLDLPVIDGDLVGFRAAPEIYVEAITLNNVNRLPIAAVNLDGDSLVLYETSNIEKIETILRTFSAQSKSETYVAGYPIYKREIENYFGKESLSFAQKIGEILSRNTVEKDLINSFLSLGLLFIDKGIITKQEDNDVNGFTKGKIRIVTAKKDTYEVVYKNEFLVLLKNNKVICTSPDSILLLDSALRRGINNSEKNVNKQVYLFSMKAIPQWRTSEGRKLFSSRNLGYNYEQKLME